MEFYNLFCIYESACPGGSGCFTRFPLSARAGWNWSRNESLDLGPLKPDFPDKTLIEVIRELREVSEVPLVVLNHRANDLEPVTTLEAGA